MNKKVHLGFVYPKGFPQEIIDEEISEVKSEKLYFEIGRQENEVYAAMEWVVPTLFATYILKPYFESFIKEAGKDHYEMLKSFCKKQLARGKTMDSHLISADQSNLKISKNYTQSHSVSITFQSKTGRQVKLLFDNNLELKDWENALEEFSKYIIEHYSNFPNDQFTDKIKDLSPKEYFVIYIKINPISKELEFHDDHTLILESKNCG